MEALDGIWRLVDSRAWNGITERLSMPYGSHPVGQIAFSRGRMLVALCNGDNDLGPDARSFNSYGGPYTFDGETLDCAVDVASDPQRVGSRQVRGVVMLSEDKLLLRPPAGLYGRKLERRELIWERVWRPEAKVSVLTSKTRLTADG
ncbi:lipocalin-like domain-containing protein [Variovorax saccharolyticus]|uniref:lipocalin-like domain-containing protein n=1 Tax=Variovorax saccharolyticus TaxID=3053516 RepID=UPI00336A01A1